MSGLAVFSDTKAANNMDDMVGGVELRESAGRALKLQTDSPHLVSLGSDRFSTAVTVHPLPPGRVLLGSGPCVDIHIQGAGVQPNHCQIENRDGVVVICPINGSLMVDEMLIMEPTRLIQGATLTIGMSNYMRFNHPAEAKLMKSALPASLPDGKPPSVPKKKSPRNSADCDSLPKNNIMMKVSKFEYLAAQQNLKGKKLPVDGNSISPKVFSANLVTVNTPARDVLGRPPPPDFHYTYNKNIPQSAVNYSALNVKSKMPDRQVFGSKHSYVNVTLNGDKNKNINNKVALFESGATHQVELNNIMKNTVSNNLLQGNKNVNVEKQNFDLKVMTSEPVKSPENKRNDLVEFQKQIVQKEVVELEKGEKARLDEILNMCAEFDKQVQSERSGKLTPNRIKTNGSLPREKRVCGGSSGSQNEQSPKINDDVFIFDVSHENQNLQEHYDHVKREEPFKRTPYENVTISGTAAVPHSSPRTRIKTFLHSPNKQAETDDFLQQREQKIQTKTRHLENYENLTLNNHNFQNNTKKTPDRKDENLKESLKKQRNENLSKIASVKLKMSQIETMGEELNSELELENALIAGECQAKQLELQKLKSRRTELLKRVEDLEDEMNSSQVLQERDENTSKEKLKQAQHLIEDIESKLTVMDKSCDDYTKTLDAFAEAQESLDCETRNFEDLEFRHLEKEADWLAGREELQREIAQVDTQIELLIQQIADLQKETNLSRNIGESECSKIERRRLEFAKFLEEFRAQIREIDEQLSEFTDVRPSVESDEDALSTDSDFDRRDLETIKKETSTLSLNNITDLSCSLIVNSNARVLETTDNMTQSFNEKILHEKSILEDVNNDIDRITKVTQDAPMLSRKSYGKKTIESLKEIERNRQLHLAQQGSQVIENERRRVLALKQKVQNEAKSEWAAKKSTIDDNFNNGNPVDQLLEVNSNTVPYADGPNIFDHSDEVTDSIDTISHPSRPLSEVSDFSLDIGANGTLNRRKGKNLGDKIRPLTRYLPIRTVDFDLRQHIESAGHFADLCPHVRITSTSCRGFLHKKGSKLNTWSRRWFVFDRKQRTFIYYSDKTEKKARGGTYFQAIEEVYLDHGNSVKSPNSMLTFVVKTHERRYYLMAPSPEAMRIWIDVIFTGAEGYQEFEPGS